MEHISIDGVVVPHRIVPMTGDGSCFFYSLSCLMYDTDSQANDLRATVVQHISNNWRRFKPFTMMPCGTINYRTKTQYQSHMSLRTTYATCSEIMAAGELYPYDIQVYRDGALIMRFGGPDEGKPVIRMKCSGPMMSAHFEPIIPVDEMPTPYDQQSSLMQTPPTLLPVDVLLPTTASHSPPPVPDEVTEPETQDHSHESEVAPPCRKRRGRKRRARFSDSSKRKRHREAVKKYSENNPEVNRKAVKKYNEKNPEVHITAVKNYNKRNPEVHRASVSKYTEKHPQVNREAVRKYNEKRSLIPWKIKSLSGFKYDCNTDYNNDKILSIGDFIQCKWCNAKKWKEESPGLCCSNGKVHLPLIKELPEPLHSLLTSEHPESEHFLVNIRKYNGCFQMTSFGAKEIKEGNFTPTFKVQGQVYHRIGSLLSSPPNNPSFLQIYFLGDDEKETNTRCNNFPNVKPWLVAKLQKVLHNHNSYINDFKTALESVPEGQEFKVVIHADRKPVDGHRGQFNAPTTSEVALVIVGQEFAKRDIILHSRDSKLQRISETHRSYDALQYPLMFCRGEDGYSIAIPQCDPNTKAPLKKTVSASEFYSFRIMERDGQQNYLLLYRSLLNQFLVDMYAKIETERLNFVRNNQSKLRTENYVHLRDSMCKNDGQANNIGKMVVLPSSFTGGPRYMHERTQDAMTYVRKYGRPDLFITFTCNPKWTEIQEALSARQKPQDRHDIIARIFHLKVKKMMHVLTKGNVFGPTRCYMLTVEWQKRGLPHVHILLWLQDRIMPHQIDSVISAEIPDPEVDPALHDIVKSTMIHGPCGNVNRNSPCMVNGQCTKRYPRPLATQTQTADDGYPQYRRRSPADGGFSVNIKGVDLDNQWVVPYNPVLSRSFLAHINVELCNSVKSIKYICKYVNKGSDQAAFRLENEWDEVSKYESGRYISTSEAAWRIFCFPIHERFPPVVQLAVHLENGQRVFFTSDNLLDKIQHPPKTTLTAFFELCKTDSFARGLLYCEVPTYYVWKNNQFCRRKQGKGVPGHPGVKKDHVLGRVYTVHPNNVECFYLCLLLHEIRGPTCFNDLKKVSGIVHPTYQSACRALGLLEDDMQWDLTLQEASISDSPHKIRELFAVILVFCQVADPLALWEKHKESLSEDIRRQIEIESHGLEIELCKDTVYNKCLLCLENMIFSMSNQSLQDFGLPPPTQDTNIITVNREYLKELSYNTVQLSDMVAENFPKLNADQKNAYNELIANIDDGLGQLFFLDAPGGTGKTFLLNLLLASVRKDRKIAISVASSGIAATLLDGGKTAHSAFKLPLNLNISQTPLCNISKQSDTAKVLKECKLIVWDECTMAHKRGIEALDRTLQDIRSSKNLMGGITVLLAGDFRQTLPVVPRGTRADEVKACLKSSYLWPKVQVRSLRVNMRVHLKGDFKAEEFSSLLLQIGDGKLKEEDGKVNIPNNLCEVVKYLKTLTDKIYPDLRNISDSSWLKERAILTPRNETAAIINNLLLEKLPADVVKYQSVDSVVEVEDAVHYPVEFLHTLNPPGIPPHNLHLKVGAPIMLLRNLIPPKLCNGTRLQVKSLHKNVVEATIFTGCGSGETVFIPRIPLIPSDYHFQFKRLQFPIKVCFAMTINKAQGQSLKMAGVDLREDCFSHGQLYVACSRVSTPDSLVILQPEGKTKNFVYKEVL